MCHIEIDVVGAMIAHSLPYLEAQSDMNCYLRDFFEEHFEEVVHESS